VRQPQPELRTVPVPKGLPAPVEHFFRGRYGNALQIIATAVITGRGTVALGPLKLPIRFRFSHAAGRDYRHYIEAAWFRIPVMAIHERYVGGSERMEFPWGVQENNPKLDQAGNLGMWAELMMWAPAVLATDSRVRWEAVDSDTAFLVVPFGQESERFLVRFDPATGKIQHWEVMRYKNREDGKQLWINGTWFEGNAGKPWADFRAEEIRLNVDVDVNGRGL